MTEDAVKTVLVRVINGRYSHRDVFNGKQTVKNKHDEPFLVFEKSFKQFRGILQVAGGASFGDEPDLQDDSGEKTDDLPPQMTEAERRELARQKMQDDDEPEPEMDEPEPAQATEAPASPGKAAAVNAAKKLAGNKAKKQAGESVNESSETERPEGNI